MDDAIQIQQSGMFKRAYKRLHPNQKADVDDAYDPGTCLLLFPGSHENFYRDLK